MARAMFPNRVLALAYQELKRQQDKQTKAQSNLDASSTKAGERYS